MLIHTESLHQQKKSSYVPAQCTAHSILGIWSKTLMKLPENPKLATDSFPSNFRETYKSVFITPVRASGSLYRNDNASAEIVIILTDDGHVMVIRFIAVPLLGARCQTGRKLLYGPHSNKDLGQFPSKLITGFFWSSLSRLSTTHVERHPLWVAHIWICKNWNFNSRLTNKQILLNVTELLENQSLAVGTGFQLEQ